MVKIWLYRAGVRNLFCGSASWMRISSASTPPTKKKKVVESYMIAIFLVDRGDPAEHATSLVPPRRKAGARYRGANRCDQCSPHKLPIGTVSHPS